MGPKGKTSKLREQKKRACAAASIKNQVNQIEHNLDRLRNSLNTLNDEYSKKTAELLAKQVAVGNLNKKLFEIDVHLENMYAQKTSGVWAISNLTREVNNQQHRIARKKSVLASNSKYLLSHGNVKNLPFLITAIKVGKRKLLPFSDEISSRAKVKRCNETYDACSLIHAGCKDNKVSVLTGILSTVGRKFTSKHNISE